MKAMHLDIVLMWQMGYFDHGYLGFCIFNFSCICTNDCICI